MDTFIFYTQLFSIRIVRAMRFGFIVLTILGLINNIVGQQQRIGIQSLINESSSSTSSTIEESVIIGNTRFVFNPSPDTPLDFVEEDKMFITTQQYQWGLDRIDQTLLPLDKKKYNPKYTGKGVDVYVLDTGIFLEHQEFEGRAIYGTHLYNEKGDVYGHGTHVASTIAGKIVGVSPDVRIIDVKVLNDGGSGQNSVIVKGIAWAVENIKKTKRCSIISMSLGGGMSSIMDRAIQETYKENILTVVSAGNSNDHIAWYSPAREPLAITVGGSDIKDKKYILSNYGGNIDIIAPAVQIYGAYQKDPKLYTRKSGTSMAAPHVSGVLAQLMEQVGCQDIQLLEMLLKEQSVIGKISGFNSETPNRFLQSAKTIPPTKRPTNSPTPFPTRPTTQPTKSPSSSPTINPTTQSPSSSPTQSPTVFPTRPTKQPTQSPTVFPTRSTKQPTSSPNIGKTIAPTEYPTATLPCWKLCWANERSQNDCLSVKERYPHCWCVWDSRRKRPCWGRSVWHSDAPSN